MGQAREAKLLPLDGEDELQHGRFHGFGEIYDADHTRWIMSPNDPKLSDRRLAGQDNTNTENPTASLCSLERVVRLLASYQADQDNGDDIVALSTACSRSTSQAINPEPMSMSACNTMPGQSEPEIASTRVSTAPRIPVRKIPLIPW